MLGSGHRSWWDRIPSSLLGIRRGQKTLWDSPTFSWYIMVYHGRSVYHFFLGPFLLWIFASSINPCVNFYSAILKCHTQLLLLGKSILIPVSVVCFRKVSQPILRCAALRYRSWSRRLPRSNSGLMPLSNWCCPQPPRRSSSAATRMTSWDPL